MLNTYNPVTKEGLTTIAQSSISKLTQAVSTQSFSQGNFGLTTEAALFAALLSVAEDLHRAALTLATEHDRCGSEFQSSMSNAIEGMEVVSALTHSAFGVHPV